jgi:hypothetical protein
MTVRTIHMNPAYLGYVVLCGTHEVDCSPAKEQAYCGAYSHLSPAMLNSTRGGRRAGVPRREHGDVRRGGDDNGPLRTLPFGE